MRNRNFQIIDSVGHHGDVVEWQGNRWTTWNMFFLGAKCKPVVLVCVAQSEQPPYPTIADNHLYSWLSSFVLLERNFTKFDPYIDTGILGQTQASGNPQPWQWGKISTIVGGIYGHEIPREQKSSRSNVQILIICKYSRALLAKFKIKEIVFYCTQWWRVCCIQALSYTELL